MRYCMCVLFAYTYIVLPTWLDWDDTPLAVYNREADEAMDVLMLEQGGIFVRALV